MLQKFWLREVDLRAVLQVSCLRLSAPANELRYRPALCGCSRLDPSSIRQAAGTLNGQATPEAMRNGTVARLTYHHNVIWKAHMKRIRIQVYWLLRVGKLQANDRISVDMKAISAPSKGNVLPGSSACLSASLVMHHRPHVTLICFTPVCMTFLLVSRLQTISACACHVLFMPPSVSNKVMWFWDLDRCGPMTYVPNLCIVGQHPVIVQLQPHVSWAILLHS